nr:unknown [Medicago truncatula]
MLFAQIDAVYSALGALGYDKMPVHISETGWPSKGDGDEVGANVENARKYNGNVIKLSSKKGTPLRPEVDLNIYVFALFNENLKPGPTSERNYGLFKPDGNPVYNLGFSLSSSSSSSSSSSNPPSNDGGNNGSTGSGSAPPHPPTSSSGYLAISEATSLDRYHMLGLSLSFLLPLLMILKC